MLIDSNLPSSFYADAQLTAAYIHNRTVHSKDDITPYQHIYGKKPDISHLRPFGCVAYAHIPAELRSKLDPPAVRCRLLGYLDDDDSVELKGYKLLRESDMTILHSRDVRFDEFTPMEPLVNGNYDKDIPKADLFQDPTFIDANPSSLVSPPTALPASPSSFPVKHFSKSLISSENIVSGSRRGSLFSKRGIVV